MMNSVDLHIHTTTSDGSDSLVEVVRQATANKMIAIAITDHDYYHKSIPECKELTVISSIEVSTVDHKTGKRVHILGYGFKQFPQKLSDICSDNLKHMQQISEEQIKALQEAGYDINLKEVEHKASGSLSIYKQHIMSVLICKGYTDKLYGDLYKKLFKNGGICCMAQDFADTEEVIDSIAKSGAIPVVAHPAISGCLGEIGRYTECGLMGLETYHSAHDSDMIKNCNALAKEYRLIETGGSDYHGYYGSEPPIGNSNEFINERGVLEYLMKR